MLRPGTVLRPGTAKTFEGYATDLFVPHVTSQLQRVDRLDIVWDLYMADSLKADICCRRGKAVRRRVVPTSAVPENWQGFLCLRRRQQNGVVLLSGF